MHRLRRLVLFALRFSSLVLLLPVLSACGGLDDDEDHLLASLPQATAPSNLTAYAGTWVGACVLLSSPPNAALSLREERRLTPLLPNRLQVDSINRIFASVNCAPDPTGAVAPFTRTDVLTFSRTETVGGQSVDRWQGSFRDGVVNPLLRVDLDRLYGTGVPPSADANGQPTSIDLLNGLSRL